MNKLLTASEVAKILDLTRNRIYELGKRNIIPCVRIGRQVRFSEAALIDWMKAGGRGLEDCDKAFLSHASNIAVTSESRG
jgi:excisionase family DNA binding protein